MKFKDRYNQQILNFLSISSILLKNYEKVYKNQPGLFVGFSIDHIQRVYEILNVFNPDENEEEIWRNFDHLNILGERF